MNKLCEDYNSGKSLTSLSTELGVSAGKVKRELLLSGVVLRTASEASRKYSINETFFDSIDSQEKAYFLGLLYADGYNDTTRNSISLHLKQDDKQILETLNYLLQPSKPLQFISHQYARDKGVNTQDQYRLIIGNKHISSRLADIGCGRCKTHTLKFPSSDVVPHHLINHFVRGYFDGDGSICKYRSGGYDKFCTSIVGTTNFLSGIQVLLESELGFNHVKLIDRHPDRGTIIRALTYSGRLKCIKFGSWMYKDARLSLTRKKDVFDLLNCVPVQ